MTPTGCPRCATDQRAQRVRVAMNVSLGLAVAFGGMSCWGVLPMSGALDAPWTRSLPAMLRMEARAACLAVLAFGVAWVGIGLRALADHLTRRAATPLPPPTPDPLATYREAPAECPRHPFAR